MDARLPDPPLLVFSTYLYRLLLRLYPAAFRQEYGAEMAQFFRDSCRRVLAASSLALWLDLWGRILLDTLKTALEEHTRTGGNMSRTRFIQLFGWAYPLAAVFAWLGIVASQYGPYSAYDATLTNQPSWHSLIVGRDFVLFFLTSLMVSLGGLALYFRLGSLVGPAGRLFAALSSLGGFVSIAGIFIEFYPVFPVGWLVVMLGLAALGLVCLTRRLSGPWPYLCLLSALPAIFVSLTEWFNISISSQGWGIATFLVLIGLTGLGMAIVFYRPAGQVESLPA